MRPIASSDRKSVNGRPGIYYRGEGKSKRFEITYRDSDGKQRWKRVEGGIRAAEAERAEIRARMGRGERVAPIRGLTFDRAADEWWNQQAVVLRPSTQSAYRANLKRLRKAWGPRKLDSLSVNDAALFIRDMEAEGRKAWTIKGALTVAGRIFDFAGRRLAWSGQNPVRLLDQSERPRGSDFERKVFTKEQLAALLNAADPDYRPIFSVAASTGMRLGEVLGLKWRSIDFETGTVSISHQLDRDGDYTELKTRRSRRIVELPASVLGSLRELKLASPDSSPDAYIFTNRSGNPHDHRNIGGRVLRATLKRAVDPMGRLIWPGLSESVADTTVETPKQSLPTFHSFRHSFASAWIANGGDLVELSRHLGHSTPAITASTYSHEFERAARSDERRQRIESMYGGAVLDSVRSDGSRSNVASIADTE